MSARTHKHPKLPAGSIEMLAAELTERIDVAVSDVEGTTIDRWQFVRALSALLAIRKGISELEVAMDFPRAGTKTEVA